MAATIAIVVLVLLAGLLGFAATRPDTFRVQRSTSIAAPPQKISALIQDFHQWISWSPWEKLDPALKRTYSGAASGTGAVYEWEGNKKAGQGRMEITDASPARTALKLDFIKPFEAHNTVDFTLEPRGDSTNVLWTMNGRHSFMSKLMCVFVNMDNLVGKDFEAGLANLKAAAEK
jgi:hypothetical protein